MEEALNLVFACDADSYKRREQHFAVSRCGIARKVFLLML